MAVNHLTQYSTISMVAMKRTSNDSTNISDPIPNLQQHVKFKVVKSASPTLKLAVPAYTLQLVYPFSTTKSHNEDIKKHQSKGLACPRPSPTQCLTDDLETLTRTPSHSLTPSINQSTTDSHGAPGCLYNGLGPVCVYQAFYSGCEA